MVKMTGVDTVMADEIPSSRSAIAGTDVLAHLVFDLDVDDDTIGSEDLIGPVIATAAEKALLTGLTFHQAPMELSIVVTDNDASQQLNRDYRGKDKPTNVLSFPGVEPDDLSSALKIAVTGGPPVMLGDLVIAAPIVQVEAMEQGKDMMHHLTHLTVHGVLHLLGYDHIEDSEAEEMENLEASILATMGIANPYQVEQENE